MRASSSSSAAAQRPVSGAPDRDAAILVNGRFLSHRITGVQRYAIEVSDRLAGDIEVIAPARPLKGLTGHLWEQVAMLGRRRQLLWSPSGSGPILRKQQVVTIHDLSFLDCPQWFSRGYARFYGWLTPRLCRRAQHVITVSEFTRRRVIELLSIAPEKVTAVPNGVDPRFVPLVDSEAIRARNRFNAGRAYVLFVGSVEPRKNLPRLIEAWKHVVAKMSEAELLIAGGSAAIYATSRVRHGEAGIRHLGYVDDAALPLLYGGAELFIYPSLYEGFGLPALEAMASGTPVVCSNSTALPEVVGNAAVTVDPTKVDELANAILGVLASGELRAGLRDRGLQRASLFSWDRTARAVSEVLANAAQQCSGNARRAAVAEPSIRHSAASTPVNFANSNLRGVMT